MDHKKPESLNPSPLGTKEYWDNLYSTELANHAFDPVDEGTIWFSDSAAEEKIVDFVVTLAVNGASDTNSKVKQRLRILDLGTGNGHLLFELRDEGLLSADMVGVDYSEKSIKLAHQIQTQRNANFSQEHDHTLIPGELRFEAWDILNDAPGDWLGHGFDFIIDKGTFDAVSLVEENALDGGKLNELYALRVYDLLKPGGHFVITSCNWTEAELRKWFETDTLRFYDKINYPSFDFGGKRGQTVSSVCFRRSNGR